MKKNLWQPFLDDHQPDILCLQEIKAKPEQITIHLGEYRAFWNSAEKPGYSGTAILSKIEPLQVINGFPQSILERYEIPRDVYGDPNVEGRIIAAEFEKFWLATVYAPNAKDDLSRLALRHRYWDPAFLAYMQQLERTKPVVFCGDLNVAHTELDLANPKPNVGKSGFTNDERAGFQNIVEAGFLDSFRLFEAGNGHYTWWSHFAQSRSRNVGWRIDYVLTSASLRKFIKAAAIHAPVLGSDHCPVSIEMDIF